jgi:hypothetical protein
VRDLATDYLEFIEARFGLAEAITPLVAGALRDAGATRIVDLCSGGGGPMAEVQRRLAALGVPAPVTLTDRFPNRPAFERLARATPGLAFVTEPVDARAVPPALRGLRTLCNAFHHFAPTDARAILGAAVEAGEGIAVFELSERTPRAILGILLTPVAVWLATPFIRPFRWSRLLLTYLVPAVPLICLWDGFVSQWRAYTREELADLPRGLEATHYRWETGRVRLPRLPGKVTFLIGVPVSTASGSR